MSHMDGPHGSTESDDLDFVDYENDNDEDDDLTYEQNVTHDIQIEVEGPAQSKKLQACLSRRIYIPKIGVEDYPRSKMFSSPEHGHNDKGFASTTVNNASLPSQSCSGTKIS
ncbi:Uncharacterized protein Fot_35094 [Forsythia ovata]|uniref:Uncharacterized protein n=1 Tax=Forsythia ovata TaxID=205694 RepID=A0ABD1SKI8_9LAMI